MHTIMLMNFSLCPMQDIGMLEVKYVTTMLCMVRRAAFGNAGKNVDLRQYGKIQHSIVCGDSKIKIRKKISKNLRFNFAHIIKYNWLTMFC